MNTQRPLLLLTAAALLVASGCDLFSVSGKKAPWVQPPSLHDAQTTYAEPADTNAFLADTFRRVLDLRAANLTEALDEALDSLYAPAATRAWLTDRFGPTLGASLADDLDAQWPTWRAVLAQTLTDLQGQLPPTAQIDRATQPRTRLASASRNLSLCAMREPAAPLSGVRLQSGTQNLSAYLEHFAFIDGAFRWVGPLPLLTVPTLRLPLPLPHAALPWLPAPADPLRARSDLWDVSPADDGGLTLRRPDAAEVFNLIAPPPPPDALTHAALIGPYVAAATRQGRLLLWSPDTAAEVARLPPVLDATPLTTLTAHPALDAMLAAAASTAWAWDTNLGKPLITLDAPAPIAAAVLVNDAHPVVWAVLSDSTLIGWDLGCLLP